MFSVSTARVINQVGRQKKGSVVEKRKEKLSTKYSARKRGLKGRIELRGKEDVV